MKEPETRARLVCQLGGFAKTVFVTGDNRIFQFEDPLSHTRHLIVENYRSTYA